MQILQLNSKGYFIKIHADILVPFVHNFTRKSEKCNKCNTTGTISGAGTAYPSGAHAFTSSFYSGSCCSILIFLCIVLQMVVFSFVLFSSPCKRQCELLSSLGVRRLLTFRILIFSSETSQPNEVKLVGSTYGRSSFKIAHFVHIY